MTDELLTPDELLTAEAKADTSPAEPVEGAEGLPDEVHTDEINDDNDTRTPEDI